MPLPKSSVFELAELTLFEVLRLFPPPPPLVAPPPRPAGGSVVPPVNTCGPSPTALLIFALVPPFLGISTTWRAVMPWLLVDLDPLLLLY